MKVKEKYLKAGIIALIAVSPFSLLGKDLKSKPNVLWITCEDISPHLGCYGDKYANTPNLDNLAYKGVRYTNAYANAPVCTPSRSTIITGIYAPSLGTQHLRIPSTKDYIPSKIKCFTEYLREAGYYCSNNSKTDYNFPVPESAWDESSNTAHWRKRKPGQPFFSVFNLVLTHQSRTRYSEEELIKRNNSLPKNLRHNFNEVILPPYYPDNKQIRVNMVALYTQITLMDIEVKKILDQLKKDGLEEETIVFFYSDHGDGIPRGKRWLHETGTNIPLIIKFPEKYNYLAPSDPNSTISRLVSFVDFAPSMLNMLGLPIPEYMQGETFLGDGVKEESNSVFLFSDRVGEVFDMSRALRNKKFRYIRNYYPFKDRMQYCEYSEITPIRKELRKLNTEKSLKGHTKWLMQKNKQVEELYNVKNDPYEIDNLALDSKYKNVLEEMKNQLNKKIMEIGDLSFLPEAMMKKRAGGRPPYQLNKDYKIYDLNNILSVANFVGKAESNQLIKWLDDDDSAIRYWAVMGISADNDVEVTVLEKVKALLNDPNASVRIAAAEAIFIHCGFDEDAIEIILKELSSGNKEIVLHAASTLEHIDFEKGKKYLPELISIYQKRNMSNFGYSAAPLKHIIRLLIDRLDIEGL
jgi:N-sulfoglucosamine sulfohydrolase